MSWLELWSKESRFDLGAEFDQELADNVRSGLEIAVRYGTLFYAAFYLLDLVQDIELYREFLALRIAAVFWIWGFGALGARAKSPRLLCAAVVMCFLGPSASIAGMSLLLDGHASTYYVGQLLVMVVVGFIPWRGAWTFLTCALIVALWAGLLMLFDRPLADWNWPFFVTSLVFMVGTVGVSSLVTETAFMLRRRLFRARLEQARANDELRLLNNHLSQQSRELERARADLQQHFVNLKDAYDHKSRFLDMISHELRTPLTCILAPLEGLLQGNAQGVLREVLGDMHRAANQLHDQIRALLDLSRYERSDKPLQRADLDFGGLVGEHIRAWRGVAQQRGVGLYFKEPEEVVAANVDRVEVAKVIRNLLSNALKFTPRGGRVTAAVRCDESRAILVVKDTGVGIPEDKQTDVFKPFVQVDSGDTRSSDGAGIGLALVQSIVLRHEGWVELDSRPGHGSTFRIMLPAGDARALEGRRDDDETVADYTPQAIMLPEDSIRGERPAPPADDGEYGADGSTFGWGGDLSGRHRMLLVEDNPNLVALLRREFKPRFEVMVAHDGREGLDKARACKPDVIVSDVMMPRMSGIEMLEALRADETLKDTPVLLLTARDSAPDRVRGLELGADDYLTKPFHKDELWARIIKLLQRRRVEQTLTRLNEEMAGHSSELEWRVRSMYYNMVRTLVAAVDAKDYYTGGHSERVAYFSVYLGRSLGLPEPEVQTLELAALLHDIGKIGIPDRVLNKPGALTGEEIHCIQQHAILSGQILGKASELDELRQIVEQHHERWDGRGYPLGLEGEDICLAARIIGVADTWDAMLSDRVYRPGMEPEVAIGRMKSLAGKDFDPTIVKLLVAGYHSLIPPESVRRERLPRPSAGAVGSEPQVRAGRNDDDCDAPLGELIPLVRPKK